MTVGVFQWRLYVQNAQEAARKSRLEAAESAYREIDTKFVEFLKLCIQLPKLDCYSVAAEDSLPPLTDTEKVQQKILYTILTDVFEVAFLQYNRTHADFDAEINLIRVSQWAGWVVYIKKFLQRRAYCLVYLDIRDEFDNRFVSFMNENAGPCTPHRMPPT